MTAEAYTIPPSSKVAQRWVNRRTFVAGRIPPIAVLQANKSVEGCRISVGIHSLNNASTIARMCSVVRRELMEEVSFVDELRVLDRGSNDETVRQARDAGAQVIELHQLMPEIQPTTGRGESVWRSLEALSGDIVVWLDADIQNFNAEYVTRLVAPLLIDPSVSFVKGYFEQPEDIDLEIDGVEYIADGGRLTELCARPLLSIFFPELGGFFQPLCSEQAGRVEVLRGIPFVSGCSVDIAILIDLMEDLGLDAMAQVDLGRRVAGTRPLTELGPRAHAIARTILARAQERKRIKLAPNAQIHPLMVPNGSDVDLVRIDEVQRPPMELVPSYLDALRTGTRRRESVLGRYTPRNGRARPVDAASSL